MKNHRILFTGITGTVARYIVPQLVENGCSIVGITRREAVSMPGVDMVSGALDDPAFLDSVLNGADVVIHAAALTRSSNPQKLKENNQDVTRHLVDASIASNVKRFIFLSSDLAEDPLGPYGASKLACEDIISSSALNDWVILRLSPFLGGLECLGNSTFAQLILKIRNKQKIWLPDGGKFQVAPIYGHDLVDLLRKVMEADNKIRTTYAVSGPEGQLSDFLNMAATKMGAELNIGNVPKPAIDLAVGLFDKIPGFNLPVFESLKAIGRNLDQDKWADQLARDFGFKAMDTSEMLDALLRESADS